MDTETGRVIGWNVSTLWPFSHIVSTMTTALGYVRQSRQTEAAASPAAQRGAIEAFAASQGWQLADVLSDIGRSGFDPKAIRPALDELLALVESGGVDRVIVWRVDRLTRRGIGEALEIVGRIRACGAALVSVTEPFDTSSALGEGIFALLLSLARAESEKLGERVRSGKAVVRERGGWLGGPTPFGFRVERVERPGHIASRLAIDPATAPAVRSMVAHVLEGGSVRSLVGRLNAEGVAPPRGREWSHASLLGLLRSPVLAGYLPDGRGDVLRDGQGRPQVHGEALLSPDEWAALALRMAPRSGRRAAVPSLLGGIAVCAGCQTTMGGESAGRAPNYRCIRSSGGRACPAPARVPMAATDGYVLARLSAQLEDEVGAVSQYGYDRPPLLDRVARWWTLRERADGSMATLVAERDELEAARARLRELYVAGDFSDDPAQYRTLAERYADRARELAAELGALDTLPGLEVVCAPGFVESLGFDAQRDLIREAVEIECVKAGRPGIKFEPDRRVRLTWR